MAEELEGKAKVEDQSNCGEDAAHLLHELQVHQAELEAQNEKLRRTQRELDASRAHTLRKTKTRAPAQKSRHHLLLVPG